MPAFYTVGFVVPILTGWTLLLLSNLRIFINGRIFPLLYIYIYIKNSVHSTPFINKNIQDTADTTLYVYLLKKKERVNMVNSVLRILKLKGVCVDCTHLLMDLFSGILLGRIIMRGTAKCTENQNWAPKVGNFMFDHGMANHLIFIISVCHWGARNYFFIYN